MYMPSPEHALADLRAQLLRRRTALLTALADVDAELADVQARYHALTQHAPVLRLPPELLARIFAYARLIWRSSPDFERVVSHVCTRWRDIAIALPNLWNTIKLDVPPHSPSALHRLSTYLSRSHPYPLDLFISCDTTDLVFDLLLPHASRWRQLCLITSSSCSLSFHNAMHNIDVPILEYLSIRTNLPQDPSPYIYMNVPSLLPQILPSAPSLSFVRLSGSALWTLQPPMSNIRTLHLEGSLSISMTQQQFRTLMATMPCLVNLSLSQLSINPSQDGYNPILMSLKRLRICDEDTHSGIILSLVDLPVIESLHLRNIEDFNSVPLPSVRSIAFESCPFSMNELWDMTQTLPAVTSLTMDQSVDTLYAILRGTSGQLKWPDLKAMTIYDLIPANVQIFCDMVEERRNAGHPLVCVRLNRRGRNVLKNKGRLEWLCNRVVVESHDAEEPWPPGLEFHDPDDF